MQISFYLYIRGYVLRLLKYVIFIHISSCTHIMDFVLNAFVVKMQNFYQLSVVFFFKEAFLTEIMY